MANVQSNHESEGQADTGIQFLPLNWHRNTTSSTSQWLEEAGHGNCGKCLWSMWCDALRDEPVTMAIQEGGSHIGRMIRKFWIERHMNNAQAAEDCSMAVKLSGETTHVTFMAVSAQWEWNENWNRLRCEMSGSASAPGDWRSWMERWMRQQVQEVAQWHQTMENMAWLLEAHAVCDAIQSLVMWKCMEDRERMCNPCHKGNILWGTGISDMAPTILAGARAGERKPDAENGLHASWHAGTTQRERRRDREQPQWHAETLQKLRLPKSQPKLSPAQFPTPTQPPETTTIMDATSPRRWETVPPMNQRRHQTTMMPCENPTLATTSRLSLADRQLIVRMDVSISLPNKVEEFITPAVTRAMFWQQAPAHIRITNPKRNASGTITAITHPNASAELAFQYWDIIIKAARSVAKQIIDVEEYE